MIKAPQLKDAGKLIFRRQVVDLPLGQIQEIGDSFDALQHVAFEGCGRLAVVAALVG